MLPCCRFFPSVSGAWTSGSKITGSTSLGMGSPSFLIRKITAFSSPTAEAYETLLLDAMRGDPTNFTRQDAVTESWRVVEPALEAWQRQAGAPHLYAAGTWGPDAADDLLARDGRRWRRP